MSQWRPQEIITSCLQPFIVVSDKRGHRRMSIRVCYHGRGGQITKRETCTTPRKPGSRRQRSRSGALGSMLICKYRTAIFLTSEKRLRVSLRSLSAEADSRTGMVVGEAAIRSQSRSLVVEGGSTVSAKRRYTTSRKPVVRTTVKPRGRGNV